MIQYIYFVKCPNCEDEHFDFFDEAKSFAMSCLSKKPIITQTEVDRNDFGECVDHCDLGTVWSWEDVMSDTENESEASVFTKDNLKSYDPDNDPEFADDPISFLISDEIEAVAGYEKVAEVIVDSDVENKEEILDVIDHIKKEEEEHIKELEAFAGIKEDEAKDDEAEENSTEPLEETVTAGVSFRNSKDFAEFKALCDEIGILTMGDLKTFMREYDANDSNIIDKLKEYRKELGPNFNIKEARKPVPEGMTIEQLVETMEENEDDVECTWCNDLFPKDMCKKEVNLGWLCPRCADGIMSRGESLTFKENNYWDFLDEKFDIDFEDEASSDVLDATSDVVEDEDFFNEDFDSNKKVDFEYDDLTITVYGKRRDADDWDEWEHTGSYTYRVPQSIVASDIWENFITEEDASDVAGGLTTLEDDEEWEKFLEAHFDDLLEKYYDKLLEYYREYAATEYQANYEED